MKLTFLGTGTSQGVPVILEPVPPTLDLNDRRNWRNRCCAHLEIDGAHLQIDAGQEFRMACLAYGVPAVDYFFLTHEHSDHILGMDDLRQFCRSRDGNAIPVYSTWEGCRRVEMIFDYAIRARSHDGYMALQTFVAPEEFVLPSGTRVQTCLLPHGRVQTLGLVFTEAATGRRIAYYTDCHDLTPEAMRLARGADLLVLDALHQKPHPTHLHIAKAVKIAQELGAKETYFTHLTRSVNHASVDAQLPEDIHLAYDGLVVTGE
ncbi:MAG: MBL fold metallo-hydrolase [Opitutales bacterium]|nr:MBL fold metallo-hydrolase [Opitutales bacterium]